jgi:hypothetical protein
MQICRKTGELATGNCSSRGLQITMDPRIPDENEAKKIVMELRTGNTCGSS